MIISNNFILLNSLYNYIYMDLLNTKIEDDGAYGTVEV